MRGGKCNKYNSISIMCCMSRNRADYEYRGCNAGLRITLGV